MSWTPPTVTGIFPDPSPSGVGGSVPLPVVTISNATAYFATTPRSAEWVALTDQQIWLNESQRYLGQLCFNQDADCCGMSFADAWKGAASELALALSKNPAAVIGSGAASTGTTGAIKEQKLGDLMQSYYDVKDQQTSASKVSSSAPLILQAFPWLTDWLGCWLQTPTGSSRILSRCC